MSQRRAGKLGDLIVGLTPSVNDVARIFQIPPLMLADPSRSTFASAREGSRALRDDVPHAVGQSRKFWKQAMTIACAERVSKPR